MTLKLGAQVLGGGVIVHVFEDRSGYYFTTNADGSGKKIRLKQVGTHWKYSLPGSTTSSVAVLADPPK